MIELRIANEDLVNNHTVSITNTNTTEQGQAETNASSNYYQLILDTTNISVSNVLEFNTSDGTRYSTTKRIVTEDNITRGGLLDFNITLEWTVNDTTPPQWSNPKTNKTTIYQNDCVNFTTRWTDNAGLSCYIFSINPSGEWGGG